MRTTLALALALVALAFASAPAAAERFDLPFGVAVAVGEGGDAPYVVYADGPADFPDPVDGFASVSYSGQACLSGDGSPDDGNATNGPESYSSTCVDAWSLPACFEYNPAALTNGCAYRSGSSGATAETPPVGTPGLTQCVIGHVCVDVPPVGLLPGMGFYAEAPEVDGYVEVTALCAFLPGVVPCRVPLP